ncbi:MAG TPA: sigma-70 family RNA polymerase sigma factor [Tepidisphaeraceae bacterium]
MVAHETTERFESTVLVHLDAAYNLARWLNRSDHDAQDVVQDACVRAFRAFDQFRGGDARAWLLTIVRNTSFSLKSGRKPVVELNEEIHETADDQLDPHLIASRASDARRVREAIEELAEELRSVIVLREMEGLSYKEIAGVLGVPIGTVMSRLSRGREKLAEKLSEPEPARRNS